MGCVGGILGKHGSIVKELSQRSGGAKSTFADKTAGGGGGGEGGNRKLTITGGMEQTYKGFNLVNERVELLEKEQQQQQQQRQHQQQQPEPEPYNNMPFRQQQFDHQQPQHPLYNIPYQAW